MPVYELHPTLSFPDPALADESGLLAVGGDLSPERLLLAYETGIFPWFNSDQPLLWWSPPERMILYPGEFHLSTSLRRRIANKTYELRVDTAFEEVIWQCATTSRKGEHGTWITRDMVRAYTQLHHLGYAHSFETWNNGQLVGGLYGISLGRAFFGESMFSHSNDASKVAFYWLHEHALHEGFHFIDCQMHTDHLASLGARLVPRTSYLHSLNKALAYPDARGKWTL